ncbi:MAG: ParB/RepB/Spo0J family partition protein [Bryobacteraceae bacterium]
MSRPTGTPRRALGRGLTSLLPQRSEQAETRPVEGLSAGKPLEIPIDLIDPNPVQPRAAFAADRLEELAASIRAHGVLQPLLVRRHGDRYQLVAGERRWRAAKAAGLAKVPVIVQEIPDRKLLEITLVENIQREDLNPIELARALDRMVRELGLSQEEVAARTGKDRTTITNTLRLLRLPADVQELVAERRLSPGHAKAILGLPREELQRQVAERAASQGLSVRQVERLVQRMTKPREALSADQAAEDPNVVAAAEELERLLGTRVRIVQRSEQRGRIEIEFYSQEDLHRIYALLVRHAERA